MQVFTFENKSLQERFLEYSEILSRKDKIIPASQIRTEWSCYFELVIEPVGWESLWKIPRSTCEEFKVHYPTVVVVQIEQVDCTELSALVQIIAVQDEIHLPAKYDVPLIELYPTKKQPNHVLDMIGTSNCIELLRFFYCHLWMPWDFDDNEHTDWVTAHLETRLRLYYDMKQGIINQQTSDIIKDLMREAKDLHEKITTLESQLSDDEDTQIFNDENKGRVLMASHIRMYQVKAEMCVLENPVMRDMYQRNPEIGNIEFSRRQSRGRKLEAFFVWHGGKLDYTIKCLEEMKEFLPDDTFTKTTANMQDALDTSQKGDSVVLGEGIHKIKNAGGLEKGGTIRGITNHQDIILCAKDTANGRSLLDFSGDVVLENVSIDLGELQAGIIVRRGLVKIINCKIFASNQSVLKLGVIVLTGGSLLVKNSTFVGLGTAVVIHEAGSCTLTKCNFENCMEGVQLQDLSRLTATNCNFSNFKEYGIRLESVKYLTEVEFKTGGIEIIENVEEINLEKCSFGNNEKGDITIRPRQAVTFPATQTNAMDMNS